jgi:hypothetical protein
MNMPKMEICTELTKARFIGEWIEFEHVAILISCKWFKELRNKRKLIQISMEHLN